MKLFAVLVLTLVAPQMMYATSETNLDYKDHPSYIELEGQLRNILSATQSQFQNSAPVSTQAESFKTKVIQRLDRSGPLFNSPELKQNLLRLADQKLENCKTPNGLELDKHCVGRATGLMMQLISAVEKINRPTTNIANSSIKDDN